MVAAQKAKETGMGKAADGIVDRLRRHVPLQLLDVNQLFFVLTVSGKKSVSFRENRDTLFVIAPGVFIQCRNLKRACPLVPATPTVGSPQN
jgi:hypothetical protein